MRVALSLLLLLGAGHPSLSCRADEVAVLGVVGSNGDGGSSKSKVICKGEMGAGSWTGRVAVVAAMYVELELARCCGRRALSNIPREGVAYSVVQQINFCRLQHASQDALFREPEVRCTLLQVYGNPFFFLQFHGLCFHNPAPLLLLLLMNESEQHTAQVRSYCDGDDDNNNNNDDDWGSGGQQFISAVPPT